MHARSVEPDEPLAPVPDVLALIEAASKASSLVWLDAADGTTPRPAWHVWHGGAAYVVWGGAEQPDPGLATADRVLVVTRSKHTQALLVSWHARVRHLRADDPLWAEVTAALAAERLNAHDAATLASHWESASTVSQLSPTGALGEAPNRYDSSSRARPPAPTPASTRGPLPRVLHRRARRRPAL